MNERTKAVISAAVVLAANVAALWGVSLDVGTWTTALCAVATVAFTCYGIWKNHNFTDEAALAQTYLDELKAADEQDPPSRPAVA